MRNICRGIAQLVEQRSPKPRAVSSSLTAPAKEKDVRQGVFFFGGNNRENSRHDDIRVYSRGARSALIPQISDDGHGEAFKYLPFCKTGK